ncbi:MAG: hypothetical protein RSD04_03750 [Clostridia bacterium]
MILEKKLIIMKGYDNSDINGVVKLESFANKTTCAFKIFGAEKNTAYIVCANDEVLCCGKNLPETVTCDNVLRSLNVLFGVALVKDEKIICVGSNGKFDFRELARKLKIRLDERANGMEKANNFSSNSQTYQSQSRATNSADSELSHSKSNEKNATKFTRESSSAKVVDKAKSLAQIAENNIPIDKIASASNKTATKKVDNSSTFQSSKRVEKPNNNDNIFSANSPAKSIADNLADSSRDSSRDSKTTNVATDISPDESVADNDFFERIQPKLEELLNTNQRDEELQELIPDSKWARIVIEGDEFYVVGLLYANGQPDLVCYGVPDINRNSPPQCKEECRQWLELEKDGRGYWLMYQSAKDGKTITAM